MSNHKVDEIQEEKGLAKEQYKKGHLFVFLDQTTHSHDWSKFSLFFVSNYSIQ